MGKTQDYSDSLIHMHIVTRCTVPQDSARQLEILAPAAASPTGLSHVNNKPTPSLTPGSYLGLS